MNHFEMVRGAAFWDYFEMINVILLSVDFSRTMMFTMILGSPPPTYKTLILGKQKSHAIN